MLENPQKILRIFWELENAMHFLKFPQNSKNFGATKTEGFCWL